MCTLVYPYSGACNILSCFSYKKEKEIKEIEDLVVMELLKGVISRNLGMIMRDLFIFFPFHLIVIANDIFFFLLCLLSSLNSHTII